MTGAHFLLEPLPEISPGEVLQAFEGLTFPPIERRLELRRLAGTLHGAAVRTPEGPVGLALGATDGEGPAQIVSLLVRPEHRRRGLGRLLLEETERALVAAGAAEVEGAFRTSWRSLEAIERLLAGGGWSPPQTRLLVARGETDRTAALARELARGGAVPDGAEIFPWSELTAAERAEIGTRQDRRDGFAAILDPFQEAGRVDEAISVGLRWKGEIAGWNVVHRVGPETIQYTALWVRADLRRLGLARLLTLEAARRRLADPSIRYGIFVVAPDNEPMRRFVESQVAGHLVTWSELRVSRKNLAAG